MTPVYITPLNYILIGGGTATSTDETRTKNEEHHQQERSFLLFESLVGRKNVLNSSNNYNQVPGEGRTLIKEVTKEYYRSVITSKDKNSGNIILNL